MKCYACKKGGGKRVKGGTTSFELILTQKHQVLAILKGGGGAKSFTLP